MKKILSWSGFLTSLSLAVFALVFFSSVGSANAAGSATVSWTPPATDEGGGALTGLTGYKVIYDTTSRWANNTASNCPDNVGTVVDVADGAATSYRFNNNLTAGQTYHFAVLAYDEAGNKSKCAKTAQNATEVSKKVTYSGDINADWVVNGGDITIMAGVYLTNNLAADVNKDGTVNGGDVTILAEDYLKPSLAL